ncbi:hypothetical protein D5272_01625 [bacterium D16-76]|nr:hypothetical protein [bacterium D16-76]
MKNTTTTTTKKRFDMGAVMRRAWAIRREAAERYNVKLMDIVWGECIRMAFAEAQGDNAESNAQAVINEWQELGEAGQVKIMQACVRKAAKNEIGYSIEDKYLQFNEVPAWGLWGHGFDEYVNETWLRVAGNLDIDKLTAKNEKRATQAKKPITLVNIVYNAAKAAIQAIYYSDVKHGKASIRTTIGKDGEEYSYIETMAESRRDNTETSACIKATLQQFIQGRDEKDQTILEAVKDGYTEREIAKFVGMSNVAVHKRIAKMREALRGSMKEVA